MESLRRICAVVALTLALTFPAFAGDVQFPGVTTPPAPPTSATCEADTAEAAPIVASDTSDVISTDTFTEITLSMLQGVMSLF